MKIALVTNDEPRLEELKRMFNWENQQSPSKGSMHFRTESREYMTLIPDSDFPHSNIEGPDNRPDDVFQHKSTTSTSGQGVYSYSMPPSWRWGTPISSRINEMTITWTRCCNPGKYLITYSTWENGKQTKQGWSGGTFSF
jgi:hypothetical protein